LLYDLHVAVLSFLTGFFIEACQVFSLLASYLVAMDPSMIPWMVVSANAWTSAGTA